MYMDIFDLSQTSPRLSQTTKKQRENTLFLTLPLEDRVTKVRESGQ